MMNNKQLTGQEAQHIQLLDEGQGIHIEMLPAWLSLQQAAVDAGFALKIASGFRDFSRQLNIWNKKFSGLTPVKNAQNERVSLDELSDKQRIHAIMLFSALPGASRHHWGTDIDIYADNMLPKTQTLQLEPWEYQQGGPFAELTRWLQSEAKTFGFYFPYDINRGGIAAEPWHLSYAPIANQCQQLLTCDILAAELSQQDILGKKNLLSILPELYQQYITNVAEVNFG